MNENETPDFPVIMERKWITKEEAEKIWPVKDEKRNEDAPECGYKPT